MYERDDLEAWAEEEEADRRRTNPRMTAGIRHVNLNLIVRTRFDVSRDEVAGRMVVSSLGTPIQPLHSSSSYEFPHACPTIAAPAWSALAVWPDACVRLRLDSSYVSLVLRPYCRGPVIRPDLRTNNDCLLTTLPDRGSINANG